MEDVFNQRWIISLHVHPGSSPNPKVLKSIITKANVEDFVYSSLFLLLGKL